jgi:lipopolysaccharide/colanic/teichoic acid biosynthesis glycosyltransferase
VFTTEQFHLLEFQRNSLSYSPAPAVIEREPDDEVKLYFWQYVDILSSKTNMLSARESSVINSLPEDEFDNIINLNKINDVKQLNKFFSTVNRKIPAGGMFICNAETLEQRKDRLSSSMPMFLFYIIFILDFILNRVIPNTPGVRKLYLLLRNARNRAISLPEVLGRLVFNGFRIVSFRSINNRTYIVAQKEKDPAKEKAPSDTMLLRAKRVGKDGKVIRIYKLRTMYPYSEYLQKFMYDNNNLKQGGKFNNDFRITEWGRILRKYWLDELPMIINLFRGELKLVGLRPLTQHYLSLYNAKIISKRSTIKPGLIPPFYSDLPKTLEEIMTSEERYIDLYSEHPFLTDVKYFYRSVTNILFRGARSS